MDIILPSVLDPEMAPPGKHVMSCFVQYAPYDIKGGWNDQKREAFGDAVVDTIARFAPNIKDIILHRQVLTPADIESTFGLTEGNIFHGELTLQQLFAMRPAVQWADYTTPIRNYYQCGSGTHPGGGITGSPGEMAAKNDFGGLEMNRYDAIVIGGGVNSLVAANMLGKRRQKRNRFGSPRSNRRLGFYPMNFHPGFKLQYI